MVAKRGYGAVKKMNLGGRTGDMMYSRGYGVDERSRRMPTELMTAPGMKKGGKVKGYKQGGVIKRQRGGPGRRNLLEEMGRLDAERMNPNRRAEKSRVIGELNRGFKKGGVAKMHAGGSSSKAGMQSKQTKASSSKAGMQSKQTKPSSSKAGMQSKQTRRSSKDAAIMKAEKARRAKVKKDMPTGRSAAASGAAKARDIAMQRKKHVLGTLKTGPSGRK